MILIGQFDSPFVRRVGIALRLYDMPFVHEPWSSFGDSTRIAAYNPLTRVPTLVLDDGEVLIESAAILDALDDLADPAVRLAPPSGAPRRAVLKICALATGLADKSVALVYERALHAERSAVWETRCRGQIAAVLALLEQDRATRGAGWWFGNDITHADIALACALRFLRDAHGPLFDPVRHPALAAHSAKAEALPVFREIAQPFVPPH